VIDVETDNAGINGAVRIYAEFVPHFAATYRSIYIAENVVT